MRTIVTIVLVLTAPFCVLAQGLFSFLDPLALSRGIGLSAGVAPPVMVNDQPAQDTGSYNPFSFGGGLGGMRGLPFGMMGGIRVVPFGNEGGPSIGGEESMGGFSLGNEVGIGGFPLVSGGGLTGFPGGNGGNMGIFPGSSVGFSGGGTDGSNFPPGLRMFQQNNGPPLYVQQLGSPLDGQNEERVDMGASQQWFNGARGNAGGNVGQQGSPWDNQQFWINQAFGGNNQNNRNG